MPLLFVPPTITKYYILDISPGRSLVEWLLGAQQQVFTIFWRNPDAAQGHFDLNTYAQAVLEARDAVAEITRQPAVTVNAACSRDHHRLRTGPSGCDRRAGQGRRTDDDGVRARPGADGHGGRSRARSSPPRP